MSNLPFPTAFIRAGSLPENYTRALKPAAATGWFDTYLVPTSRPVPMVGTEDVSKEVARLLARGWSGKKVMEHGSPVSPDDLASAMSEVLNRPVQARAVPREQWTASLEKTGMQPNGIRAFEEMEDGFNSGWIDFGVAGTESVPATLTPKQVFANANQSDLTPQTEAVKCASSD